MIDYTKFVARRDAAIAKMEASIKDWRDKEGFIVDPDARRGLVSTIKGMESRLVSLRNERKAFLALIEEFKRLDAERNPPLPLGVEPPPSKGSGKR